MSPWVHATDIEPEAETGIEMEIEMEIETEKEERGTDDEPMAPSHS